jgi:hypothetical protein
LRNARHAGSWCVVRVDRGLAAKAAGLVAAAGLIGWAFESNVAGIEGNGAAQGQICAQVHAEAESMPEAVRAEAHRQARAACEAGFGEGPDSTLTVNSAPAPARAKGPAAEAEQGDPADVAPEDRATVPPPAEAPLRARRLGRLPRDGRAVVAGVRLPQGSRRHGYWATNAPAREAVTIADRLARAFPKTGLWPVLWAWEETPDDYAVPESPAGADDVDVRAALARVWARYRTDGTAFGALAHGSAGPVSTPRQPFAQLAGAGGLEASDGAAVLLVAVRRPADAVAAIGAVQSEVAPVADLTAVARSWEDRFGAVLVALSPTTMTFSVGSPPDDEDQVRALAAEQIAFAPEGDTAEVDEQAAALARDGAGGGDATSRDVWFFGWPD